MSTFIECVICVLVCMWPRSDTPLQSGAIREHVWAAYNAPYRCLCEDRWTTNCCVWISCTTSKTTRLWCFLFSLCCFIGAAKGLHQLHWEKTRVCSSSRTNIFKLTFPSIANSESAVGCSFICLDCGRTLEDAERHWQTRGNTGRTWCCPFRVGTYVTACWSEFANASLNSQSCKMGEIVKPDAECVHLLSS